MSNSNVIILEKIFFFIIFTKTFTTQKILKMENKHPEDCLSKVELVLNYGSQFSEFIVYC